MVCSTKEVMRNNHWFSSIIQSMMVFEHMNISTFIMCIQMKLIKNRVANINHEWIAKHKTAGRHN